MPNVPIANHPLVGASHIFRADLAVDGPIVSTEPGVLILGPGMRVEIRAVFANWNDVPGLDMLAVFVPETGYSTHVTPTDLGIKEV